MLLGYAGFLALLFLPGIAFMEIFRVGIGQSLAERLGLAFGISMSLDVVFLAVRASGISPILLGIDSLTLGAILGVSLIALAVTIAIRRKLSFYVEPTRDDLVVLGLVVVQALLVFAYFSKYPIFPRFSSADFTSHVRITADLQAGRIAVFPGGLLYYGAHLLMGSLLVLSGDLVLVVTQYAMGMLTILSPLLVFVAVNSISGNRRAGLAATVAYVVTGFVWFGSVFDAGLYANFFGILSILLLFAFLPIMLREPRNPAIWLGFALILASGYLSHYSFVTIIPALFVLPIAMFLGERKLSLPSVVIPIAFVLPGIVGAIVRPDLVGQLVSFVQAQTGGNVAVDTPLSASFAGWPVLRYVFVEINDDAAALLVVLLAVYGIYIGIRGRSTFALMLLVWLLALLVIAPFTEAAWRFSYMALAPFLIFASLGLEALWPKSDDRAFRRRSKMTARADYRRYRIGFAIIILLLLAINSWSWQLVADSASDGAANNRTQHGIIKAMQWMNSTTPFGSQVVSVTSSVFNYYELLFGRQSGYAPLATPDEVVASAGISKIPTYVVLTEVGTVTPPSVSQNPFILYPKDNRFHMLYNDSGVVIFKLGV